MGDLSVPPELARFRRALLHWYGEHHRALPWRGTRDPYAILVAEVLLQQTRAEQAQRYYARFLQAFPDFKALAQASEEEVLQVWAGAGYYRRARNLHRLAQIVAEQGLPRSYDGLLSLPGVGPYTAAAVASIAFGEPVAVVDGNVRRVLARLFAVEQPSARWLRETAQSLLEPSDPGTWNQALMELGALVCTPKNPRCGGCPVAAFCQGREEAQRYPAQEKRRPREVEAVALVLRGRRGYLLERRDGQALAGLWGFPLAEGRGALLELLSRYGIAHAEYLGTVVHTFTHKKLSVHVYGAAWEGEGDDPSARPLSVLDQKILALLRRTIDR